ncbi:hypothetical protein ACKS0A_12321 [Histoplasma ohiense]
MTIASRSWNICDSSSRSRSIFRISSCLARTICETFCASPRRSLCIRAWLNICCCDGSWTASFTSSSVASGRTIRYCLAICASKSLRKSDCTAWKFVMADFSFRSTLPI